MPVTGELYFSSKELGAFKVAVDLEDFDVEALLFKRPINYHCKEKIIPLPSWLVDLICLQRHESMCKQMRDIHGEVKLISKGSSLKLCMVAEGTANCYPRFAPTMEWDTAAGQAICEHAGFEVIDWDTKKNMLYNREELLNNWFIVSKG